MKKRLLIFIFLPLFLQGCFIYDDYINWQDSESFVYYNKAGGGENFKKDTSVLKVRLEIERADRYLLFPFVYCVIHRSRPLFHPTIKMSSMDQKVTKFFDLNIDIRTIEGDSIFQKNYQDTVLLTIFDEDKYNANGSSYKKELIPELKKVKDSILINYRLKLINNDGSVDSIERRDMKYIRISHKSFGPII